MNPSSAASKRTLCRGAPTMIPGSDTTDNRRRSGLTLVETTLSLLACFAILVALQLFGFAAMLSAFRAVALILTLTILWGLAYLRAPDLTRNTTALALVAILTLSLLPIRALHVREAARRQTVTNSMRVMGQVIQASQDAGPRAAHEGSLREDQRSESAADVEAD